MDRTRASDTERERVVRLLGDAAATGRLTVEELERRSEAAYAAVTRGDLAALVDDLPVKWFTPPAPAPPPPPSYPYYPPPPPAAGIQSSRPQPSLGCRPHMAGDLPFSIQWRGPADPRDAGAQVIEHIVPMFREAGYEIAERKPDRLVLRRRMSDFAELMVRSKILTPNQVTIAMTDHGDHSLTEVYGVASHKIRVALSRRFGT